MLILFDNGTPRGIARELDGHTVREARENGWDVLRNGELLDAAEAAGFDILLTTDKNIRYQQNLTGRVTSKSLTRKENRGQTGLTPIFLLRPEPSPTLTWSC